MFNITKPRPSLKNYALPLPSDPLRLRAGYHAEKFVGYFHIVGMPTDRNREDFDLAAAQYVMISDGGKIGHFYPAQYNSAKDQWEILGTGIHYENGEIKERLTLSDVPDDLTDWTGFDFGGGIDDPRY